MKQSLALQTSGLLPRYMDDLPDGRYYIFKNAPNSNEPGDHYRALRAFINGPQAWEWARVNLGENYTVTSCS